MTGRRRALAVGAAIAGLYVVLAGVSGRISILARRPVLDGFAPPPPYRWVSPPPSLASSNKRPSAGRFTIGLDPTAGSEPNVFTTKDLQASLALARGAVPPRDGDTSVLLVMSPLAPDQNAVLPSGERIAGNVYRITATYQPSGTAFSRFTQPGQLVLSYPLLRTSATHHSTIVHSVDGHTWTAVSSIDSTAQQLVQGNVRDMGLYAVGQSTSGPAPAGSTGHLVTTILIWAGLGVIALALVLAEIRHRRTRKRSPRPPARRRRPPDSRRRADPWE